MMVSQIGTFRDDRPDCSILISLSWIAVPLTRLTKLQNINVVVWCVNARLDPDLSFKLGGSHVISWRSAWLRLRCLSLSLKMMRTTMRQRGLDVSSYDVLCVITRIRGSGIFSVLTGKLNF